jgi:hypothetical protein
MSENEIVIVGPPRAVALVRPPDPVPPEQARTFTGVDILAPYKDGYLLVACRLSELPRLREAGAEVLVVEADANAYADRVETLGEQELVAFIDQRAHEARQNLQVADVGRARDQVET